MSTEKRIVIVTNKLDEHADIMVTALNKLGEEPIRLNTEDAPLKIGVHLEINNFGRSGKIVVHEGKRTIDLESIKSIWWRRPEPYTFPVSYNEDELKFAKSETIAMFRAIWASTQCFWVSRPDLIQQAELKIEQLHRAKHFGFCIPKTIVTTEPEKVRAFYKLCDQKIIYKVLTTGFLNRVTEASEDSVLHTVKTTLLNEQHLETLNNVSYTPCIFQEYVEKAYEIRVTVIGEQIFAAKICSQDNERTQVDWRDWSVEIPYEQIDLPKDLEAKCLAYVRSYGLNFSALDFVYTPDSRFVFLENNPNGQFMWVEQKVPELQMTAHLASCLVQGRAL